MTSLFDQSDIDHQQFLQTYWQKRPILLKGALKEFIDPICADELAGLAMEEELESRIVSQQHGNWLVNHGPFTDFEHLGEDNWTLLVQAVNHWHPDVNKLIDLVNFLPKWRIDDVMVSFSTPGGGVGPHLDQYDVFIIQGEGQRRWQVGEYTNSPVDICPHPDLKQVQSLGKLLIDEVTEAGDVLYIPPGFPHNGVALSPALNYSIGFQAPHAQELISSFADDLIDQGIGQQRMADSDRQAKKNDNLSSADFNKLKQMLIDQLDQADTFAKTLGCFLTKVHHELDIVEPDPTYTFTEIQQQLQDSELEKVAGLKQLIIDDFSDWLFINGEALNVQGCDREFVALLASESSLTTESLKSFSDSLKNQQLLTRVVNMGYRFFV